jgi:hypothetical protein
MRGDDDRYAYQENIAITIEDRKYGSCDCAQTKDECC